jgi:hypothetical protein
MAESEKPKWLRHRFSHSVEHMLLYGPGMKVGIAALPFVEGSLTTVIAQIDTGAHGSAISPNIVKKLKLEPTGGLSEVRQAGYAPYFADYYGVRLALPHIDIDLDIAGLKTLEPPHDVLIGRDILASYRLSIDFTIGLVELHFRQGS